MRQLLRGDHVSGEEQPARERRAEPVEEHVQRSERRSEKPRRGHPDHRVARHHGDVRHQRHLEPAAEGEPAHLGHDHLRIAQEVVVEVEGLAVDGQPPPLARPLPAASAVLFGVRAVPGVGVCHVGARAEDAAAAAQQHDLDVVVRRELVQIYAELLAHRRVVRVAAVGIVEREASDARALVALHQHTAVAHGLVLLDCAVVRASVV